MRANVKWTQAELDRLRLLAKTLPDAEIAAQMGRTVNSITSRRMREGITGFNNREWTGAELKRLKELVRTMTDKQVAKEMGRTAISIKGQRRKHGYRRSNAQWTPWRLDRLKELAGTMTAQEIGKLLDCSEWAVRNQIRLYNLPGFSPGRPRNATPHVRQSTKGAAARRKTAHIDRMLELAARCA
jgi:DNA-binding CsgD family transcriptional regulator